MSCDGVCITIDMDWAHDDVLRYTLQDLIRRNLTATWFVTHDTPLIREIRDAGHELGLHPNFNHLLETGDGNGNGCAVDILLHLLAIAPQAKCVRSHSLFQSSRLAILFADHGLSHDANTYLPFEQVGLVSPWRGPAGLVHVPHGWEDDIFILGGRPAPRDALALDGVFVLDFHPIHFFLNSRNDDDYNACRGHWDDVGFLAGYARKRGTGGVADQLRELFDDQIEQGVECVRLVDLRPQKVRQ